MNWYRDRLAQRAKKSQSVKLLQQVSVYDIIVKPVLTEKTMNMQEQKNQYVFVVDKRATKNDIKRAIKEIYGVEPIKVNTINIPEKRRFNRLVRRPLKKAIVVLKSGDKINVV